MGIVAFLEGELEVAGVLHSWLCWCAEQCPRHGLGAYTKELPVEDSVRGMSSTLAVWLVGDMRQERAGKQDATATAA